MLSFVCANLDEMCISDRQETITMLAAKVKRTFMKRKPDGTIIMTRHISDSLVVELYKFVQAAVADSD